MNNFFISKNFKHLVNKKISVLLASRSDIETVESNVLNIFELASTPDNIEMLIRVDDDDLTICDLVNGEVFNRYNTKLYVGVGHGYLGVNKYYNELISMSTGDILFHWGNDVTIITDKWDEKLYPHIGSIKCLQNLYHIDGPSGRKVYPTYFHSCVITRTLYDILRTYSPCSLSDSYYQYLSEIVGIWEMSGIKWLCDGSPHNEKGWDNWEVFASEDNMIKIRQDARSVMEYMDSNGLKRSRLPCFHVSCDPTPKIEIRGGDIGRSYIVEFVDKIKGVVVDSSTIETYNWRICYIEDCVLLSVRVRDLDKNIIFEYDFDEQGSFGEK